MYFAFVFFFKQKTAYEMRISDWSSDVCSSDLPPTYTLRDPELQPWKRDAARAMDRGIDWIVGAPSYPDFEEPRIDRAESWPEVVEARASGLAASRFRYAPERTPHLRAARVLALEKTGRASGRGRVCQSV